MGKVSMTFESINFIVTVLFQHNFDFHEKKSEDFSVFPYRHKRVPKVSRNMWKWLLYQHPWILQMSL